MRLRGIAASLLALAVAMVVPIAVATPAHAGAEPAVVSWSGAQLGPTTYTCAPSTGSVRANPGSRITLHNSCAFPQFYLVSQGGTLVIMTASVPAGGQTSITSPTTLGSYVLTGNHSFSSPVTLIVTDTPINEPTAHDEFQQVGVPASGDCADVAPETGHYPGYPIGGWSKSWAHWINDGIGGPVCTREVEQRPDGEIVLIG